MISKQALRQLTQQFGEPVTVRFATKSDVHTLAAVQAHCEKALNAGQFLCMQGPNDGELSIFPLPEEKPAVQA